MNIVVVLEGMKVIGIEMPRVQVAHRGLVQVELMATSWRDRFDTFSAPDGYSKAVSTQEWQLIIVFIGSGRKRVLGGRRGERLFFGAHHGDLTATPLFLIAQNLSASIISDL